MNKQMIIETIADMFKDGAFKIDLYSVTRESNRKERCIVVTIEGEEVYHERVD